MPPEEKAMQEGLTLSQRLLKRSFDIGMSLVGLLICGWLVLICFVLATIDTRKTASSAKSGRPGRKDSSLKSAP